MRAAALALAAAATAACSDDATTSLLDGPRVVAIVADPPTVAADGVAQLALVTALDGAPAAPDEVSWRACSPAWPVADPVRDCSGDRALALPVAPDGRAVVDVAAVAARFGLALPPAPADGDPCGRAVVPVTIVVEAELGGARLIARKQLDVGAAPPPRTNPAFVQVRVDGAPLAPGAPLPAGATVALSADLAADALDEVCEPDGEAPARHEDVRVAVYAGGGATLSELAFDVIEVEGATITGAVELTLPEAPDDVPLWLVAVDEGGGVAVWHDVVPVR